MAKRITLAAFNEQVCALQTLWGTKTGWADGSVQKAFDALQAAFLNKLTTRDQSKAVTTWAAVAREYVMRAKYVG